MARHRARRRRPSRCGPDRRAEGRRRGFPLRLPRFQRGHRHHHQTRTLNRRLRRRLRAPRQLARGSFISKAQRLDTLIPQPEGPRVLNAKATRWGAFAVTCLLVSGAASLLGAQARPRRVPPTPAGAAPSLRQLDDAIESLARTVSPSVVQIVVTALGAGGGPERTGVLERQRVLGSGVIVDPTGFIMTNAHVVN